MYPRLPNIYKKFNGIEYVHWEWYRDRIRAEHEAAIMRAQGYKIRITKATSSDGTFYAVWKNPITSIQFHEDQENRAKLNLAKMVEAHGTAQTGRF